MMDNKDYNRIKVALVEQKKTARWLSDALGKDPATISKWCTNTTQPSLEMLFKISELLQVPILDLVRKLQSLAIGESQPLFGRCSAP